MAGSRPAVVAVMAAAIPSSAGRSCPRLRPPPPDESSSFIMSNRIVSTVMVSDTGPPGVRQCSDGGFLTTDKRMTRRSKEKWLPIFLLLITLSALPNSCSSAASIPHQTARRSLAGSRHHLTTTARSIPPWSSSSSSRILSQCPWLEWEHQPNSLSSDDAQQHHQADMAGTRAYMAPVVFEGKARSRSDGPVYRVTFDVVTVYKGEVAALAGSQVRLEFKSGEPPMSTHPSTSLRSPLSSRAADTTAVHSRTLSAGRRSSRSSASSSSNNKNHSGQQRRRQHHHRHQHENRRGECLVTAEIRTGRRYLVFAAHWGPNNFTAFGSPLVHTKKSLKDVRSTLCPRCARSPVAYGLEESVTVKKQQRLVLRCRTRGNPVPGVVWYKDGKPLNAASKRVRIKTKRRRSTLRIRCVKEEDAGLYECRPINVIGSGTASRSKVTVVKVTGPSSSLSLSDFSSSSKVSGTSLRPANGSSSSLWPLIALPCPIDSFCLNGGTCKYYEAVGELVCQCAEGYKGQRCENKDIYNLGKGGKCRGGRMVGTKCVPTYGGGPVAGIGGGTSGSLLGPTAAAGWAAVPNSNNQLTWWHWIQASGKINANYNNGDSIDEGEDQHCGGDDDDD